MNTKNIGALDAYLNVLHSC